MESWAFLKPALYLFNMENQILDQIIDIIRKVIKQPHLQVSVDTTANDVSGWDSLHHIMIITEVETTFNLKFDFMEILEMKSIGDICRAVNNHK